MHDAIHLLLEDKQHPTAQKLLTFHRNNLEFLPRIAAEFRLLMRLGRKGGSIESLIHFLRWEQHWVSANEFEIDDKIRALAARVCVLLWPDLNGMMKFHRCDADEILGTEPVRRGKRCGRFVNPGKYTLNSGCSFLAVEQDASGDGLTRPIQLADGSTVVMPPQVPVLDRPATNHSRITEAEAEQVVIPLRRVIKNSPDANVLLLIEWRRHFEAQPELFAFMQSKLQQRETAAFSPCSILEYCRWSIRRAAVSPKRFTLPSRFNGLYCRALVLLNPRFNGFCKFRDNGKLDVSNRLLGCTLRSKKINGEPYRRLVCAKEGQ